MILVKYSREDFAMQVVGHAGSDVKGQDLVCAAVSILVHILDNRLNHAEDDGMLKHCNAKLCPGFANFFCTPKNKYREKLTTMFDLLFEGFQLLEKNHPDNVRCVLMKEEVVQESPYATNEPDGEDKRKGLLVKICDV